MKRVMVGLMSVLVACVGGLCAGCSDLLVYTLLGSGTAVAGMVSLIGAFFSGLGQIKVPGITVLLALAVMLPMAGCAEADKARMQETMSRVDEGVRTAKENGMNAVGVVHLKSGGHVAFGPALSWDGPIDAYIIVTGQVEGYGQDGAASKQPVGK